MCLTWPGAKANRFPWTWRNRLRRGRTPRVLSQAVVRKARAADPAAQLDRRDYRTYVEGIEALRR